MDNGDVGMEWNIEYTSIEYYCTCDSEKKPGDG